MRSELIERAKHTLGSPWIRKSEAGVIRDLIATLSAEGWASIPSSFLPACRIEGTLHGRWARLQVVAQRTGMPLLDMAVALHSRAGGPLWRRLLEEQEENGWPVGTSREDVPPEPWCSGTLLPAIDIHPDAAAWLPDLERSLAWALYLMREGEL